MDRIILRQRIVGTLVLASVGIILWSTIFVTQESEKSTILVEVPPAPNIERVSRMMLNLKKLELDDEKMAPLESAANSSERFSSIDQPLLDDQVTRGFENSSASRVRSIPPETPKLDESGLPVTYVLQVASMVDRSRATKMRDALIKLNFKAFLREARVGQTTVYRIYVGPKFEKRSLILKKAEIDKTFSVDSVILRYSP